MGMTWFFQIKNYAIDSGIFVPTPSKLSTRIVFDGEGSGFLRVQYHEAYSRDIFCNETWTA